MYLSTIKRVKKTIKSADITNSDGSVFFNGLNFVEKCAFSFKYEVFDTAWTFPGARHPVDVGFAPTGTEWRLRGGSD